VPGPRAILYVLQQDAELRVEVEHIIDLLLKVKAQA
jgi:hypothetical protein